MEVRWYVGPGVPRPGRLPVTQEAPRMLSCNSGLGQKRYNEHRFENPVCIIFLQMVTCIKPRLLTRKPKEHQKLRRPRTCMWRCLWTRWVAGPAGLCPPPSHCCSVSPACVSSPAPPQSSPWPLECSLSPAVSYCSSFRSCAVRFPVCPSFPPRLFCCQDPSQHTSQFVTAYSAVFGTVPFPH